MTERGLLFVAPMVRAIGRDVKVMTRRNVNCLLGVGAITEFGVSGTAGYDWHFRDRRMLWNDVKTDWVMARCPYGQVGDHLWVRETCRAKELTTEEAAAMDLQPGLDGVEYQADDVFRPIANSSAASEAWSALHGYRGKRGAWVNSIHMPRWASRHTLEITYVGLQRLTEITDLEAGWEGIEPYSGGHGYGVGGGLLEVTPVGAFMRLWESINGEDSWTRQVWVWVLKFKRLTPAS